MKILHNTQMYLLMLMCLVSSLNGASALTLRTSENHYLVSPQNEHDVQRAIYDSSPMLMNQHDANSHKYVGMHEARYSSPSYELKYRPGKLCFIHSIDVQFYSNIFLPKLNRDAQQYNDKTMMKFDTELYEIKTHELQHRKIYIAQLQNTLDDLRTINQKNSKFKDCQSLQKYIHQSFQNAHTAIQQQNLDLDCYEYGNKFDLAICKKARTQHQKVEQGSFSSLIQDDHSKKVVSYEDETQHTECQGKLIEPFKGKFYCVPEDSYSEW